MLDSGTQDMLREEMGDRIAEEDLNTCSCGSGLERYPLHDARGIFCAYVCDKCVDKVKGRYRSEIFEDSGYYADEPIEPEDY